MGVDVLGTKKDKELADSPDPQERLSPGEYCCLLLSPLPVVIFVVGVVVIVVPTASDLYRRTTGDSRLVTLRLVLSPSLLPALLLLSAWPLGWTLELRPVRSDDALEVSMVVLAISSVLTRRRLLAVMACKASQSHLSHCVRVSSVPSSIATGTLGRFRAVLWASYVDFRACQTLMRSARIFSTPSSFMLLGQFKGLR